MRNLTPKHMRCAAGASCPSIHQLPDGRLLIVGKKVTDAELDVWDGVNFDLAIGDDEVASIISPDLLSDFVGKAIDALREASK